MQARPLSTSVDVLSGPGVWSAQGASSAVGPQPSSPGGSVIAALTIASAVSIGSNLTDVGNGAMTIPEAVLNGLAKGAAASLILHATSRSTAAQVALAAAVLAGAGYLIDSAMKKSKQELCRRGDGRTA